VSPLADVIDALADANGFAGVVSVDRGGEVLLTKAYGLAHRAHRIPNTVDTWPTPSIISMS
jgi:CubicO group peptidase (beta-lactamase class C family)